MRLQAAGSTGHCLFFFEIKGPQVIAFGCTSTTLFASCVLDHPLAIFIIAKTLFAVSIITVIYILLLLICVVLDLSSVVNEACMHDCLVYVSLVFGYVMSCDKPHDKIDLPFFSFGFFQWPTS